MKGLVLGLALASHGVEASEVSPVQKVTQLLSDLEAKIQKDGAAEEKAYAAYADWCKNGAKDKGFEIKTTKTEIEGLSATIEKAAADITEHTSKVEDLGAAISSNDADLSAAKEIRKRENSEYVVVEKELTDSIDTLERAVNVLEKKMRGSELLQAKVDRQDIQQVLRTLATVVEAAAFTLQDKNKLLGLVQSRTNEDDEDVGAPAAAAYKGHSGSIIDTLEDLKQKAVEELESARKAEVSAQHNFDMLQQSLEDQIKVGTKEMGEAKSTIHEATETKAGAEGELHNAKAELADAENVLQNMESDCRARAEDHQSTVENRAEELKAIAAAKDAISGMGSDGTRLVYGPGSTFLQVASVKGGSKLQTHSDLINFEVVNLVRKIAREQKSPALAQLAIELSGAIRMGAVGGADPFGKVRNLISKMIERLEQEAGQDASHKEYCDKEFAETEQKTGELKHDIGNYAAKLDKAKSESATLKDEVANLQAELAEIAKSQANADKGLNGVRLALKILRDYYDSSSSLVQQPAAPETHEASAGAGSGIIGMLEVVASDFGKGLATTEMNEEAAATAYQKLTMENKLSKSMKEQDVKYKTKAAVGLDKAASELTSDLESAQTELDAVLEYTKNIRGMCEVKPESYEERKGRRDAELAGLKDALEILQGSTALLQQTSHLRRAAAH